VGRSLPRERIYKALQGRDKLTPKDMLAVQTDIYSEVDQEMGTASPTPSTTRQAWTTACAKPPT
jgi:hypothetical protein